MKKNQMASWVQLFSLNAFLYIAGVFYGPFISAYYVSKGLSPSRIGNLQMIGPLAVIFIQPLWARISDGTGKRKVVLAFVVLGSGLSMLMYYLELGFAGYLTATVCVTAFTSSIGPLSNALVIENAEKHHLSFATIRLGGTIGYAVAAVWAGRFLKIHQEAQFLLSFAGYMVLLLLVLTLEDSGRSDGGTPNGVRQQGKARARKSRSRITDIFVDEDVWFVLVFAFLCQAGLSFYGSFLGPYILEKGFTQSEIGIMNSISAVSEIPILLLISRIMKRFGTMKILVMSGFFVGLRLFLATGGGILGVVLAQILQSVTYMTVFYACAIYIHEHVASGCQSQGQSILSVVQVGIGAVAGNIAGGRFVEWLGYRGAYTVMSVLITAATAIVLLIYIRFHRGKGKCEHAVRCGGN